MSVSTGSSYISEIEYDERKKKSVIIENWIKMLYNRGWLNGTVESNLSSVQVKDHDIYTLQGKKTTYSLKFILRKISTVRKVEDIDDFLEAHRQNYKFFVVSQMLPKAQKQLLEYDNVEVFSDEELLENIIDNILVPIHIVLTDEEADKYLEEYHLKKSELSRMFTSDPIAKYYNMKTGQMVKIIRPSVTGGQEIAIRVIVPGTII